MSLIFKSIVCLIGAVALFTGCSKEHGVLSADDASLRNQLFSLSGYASLSQNSHIAKVSSELPTEVIRALEDSKNPKIGLVWRSDIDLDYSSSKGFVKVVSTPTEVGWPLKFDAKYFEAPPLFVQIPEIPEMKDRLAVASIWLFNDTDNDDQVNLHLRPDSLRDSIGGEAYFYLRRPNKDWMLGIAKYHFVIYVADSQMAERYNNWADSLIQTKGVSEGEEVWTNLKPGYNLMEAVNVRDTIKNQGTEYEHWEQTYDYFKSVASTTPVEMEFRTNGTSYTGGVVGY